MRLKTLPIPRYIDATMVDEGDVIRVTWKVLDVEHTRTAKVARIVDEGNYKLFLTPEGQEIVRYNRQQRKVKFTLLAENPVPAVPLFEM